MSAAVAHEPRLYGRGTGIPDPIDVHVGARIRTRRLFLGMNQESLGKALGLTFQQVQKYEGGANRVSASRLKHLAAILGVSVGFFFADQPLLDDSESVRQHRRQLQDPAMIGLIRLYETLPSDALRASFLALVKAIAATPATGGGR